MFQRMMFRGKFLDARDPRHRGPVVQPLAEGFDRHSRALRNDLDRPVGQIAGETRDGQPLSFESRALAEVHTLHPAGDPEAPGYRCLAHRPAFRQCD